MICKIKMQEDPIKVQCVSWACWLTSLQARASHASESWQCVLDLLVNGTLSLPSLTVLKNRQAALQQQATELKNTKLPPHCS